jgi:hypothetical protein
MNIQKFDYSTDLDPVILWQYDQATNLNQLIIAKQNWLNLNEQQFLENWFLQVFNLAGSDYLGHKDFGLAVWSIILLTPLFSFSEPPAYTTLWGFETLGNYPPDYTNFTQGPFYYTDFLTLTLPEQQFLLLLKYYNSVSRGALTDFSTITFPPANGQHWKADAPLPYLNNFPIGINYFFVYLLTDLFNGPNLGPLIGYTGNIYCLDNFDMTITYQFTTSDFPSNLFTAITNLDLWPRPAGVKAILP